MNANKNAKITMTTYKASFTKYENSSFGTIKTYTYEFQI